MRFIGQRPDPITPPPTLKLGLRFAKSQARVLRSIREQAEAKDVPGDLSLYEKAAESAEQGEPLVIHCTDPAEVEHMAAMLVALGVKRPAIEELSG